MYTVGLCTACLTSVYRARVCICRFTLEHTESVWVYVGVHSQDKALECIQWECTQWVYVGEHTGFMYGLSFEFTQSFAKCMQGPFGCM